MPIQSAATDWQEWEDQVLLDHYEVGGYHACSELLPHRREGDIKRRASEHLGLRCLRNVRNRDARKSDPSPEQIREACAAIQAGWTKAQERHRWYGVDEHEPLPPRIRIFRDPRIEAEPVCN